MNDTILHLFEGFGVELEYAIVDRETLSVLPITDRLIHSVAGSYESEIERGDLCWSNELVLHVVELKTNGPSPTLDGLAHRFLTHVRDINRRLEPLGGRLMPTAMHPWMNPERDTQLWPHQYNAVYESYNRIFDCRGHGWSNLQSAHLNLPFSGDGEFGSLHAAIRLVLPLIPALGASSPLVECRTTDFLDNRMEFYRTNSSRIPSVTGALIPEAVFNQADYERNIFQPMFQDIAPYDPDGILQYEWLNARGAIARFDRNAIEIRVVDIQETPEADLAIAYAISSVLQALISERWSSFHEQKKMDTGILAELFRQTVRDAEKAPIRDETYLRLLGMDAGGIVTAGELWDYILGHLPDGHPSFLIPLRTILREGSLSSRILRRLNGDFRREALSSLYRELCDCLEHGRMFLP